MRALKNWDKKWEKYWDEANRRSTNQPLEKEGNPSPLQQAINSGNTDEVDEYFEPRKEFTNNEFFEPREEFINEAKTIEVLEATTTILQSLQRIHSRMKMGQEDTYSDQTKN